MPPNKQTLNTNIRDTNILGIMRQNNLIRHMKNHTMVQVIAFRNHLSE